MVSVFAIMNSRACNSGAKDMVHLITRDNNARFREQLRSMHRDRKRVFVDRLKWNLRIVEDELEIDQFDTNDAIYLLEDDPKSRTHRGSVRLLPSTKPHLLGSVFPHLCENGVPVGDDIWEVTRLVTTPHLQAREPARIRHRLATAMVEFGLLYGINRYTCIAETSWLSQLMAMGWRCEPLGLPRLVDKEMIGALAIHINPATLQLFHAMLGTRSPVLEIGLYAEAA
jgi:N-acyl-L-homoserine lactone synthetase